MYDRIPSTFSELLEPYPPMVQEIAHWLRDLLLLEFPQVAEQISGGQKLGVALYSVGSPDRVALGIQPGSSFVKFFLHDPTALPASRFKLEGAGKHSRHIKLRSIPIDEERAELLRLAAVPVRART